MLTCILQLKKKVIINKTAKNLVIAKATYAFWRVSEPAKSCITRHAHAPGNGTLGNRQDTKFRESLTAGAT